MAQTVQDIVNRALRRINIIAAGEVPAYDDSADALEALNDLIDQWAAERLVIYTITETTWTIVSGTQTYLIGASQAINRARPVFVEHVNYRNTSQSPVTEYQLEPLTDDAWSKIPTKTLTNTLPTSWYYNPTFSVASPYGTLKLWPVPTSATLQGVLYAPTAVTEFAALTDSVSLPPAYKRMLVSNLAIEIAPEYGMSATPDLIKQATESLAWAKAANMRMLDMSVDSGALIQGQSGRFWYDINAGP